MTTVIRRSGAALAVRLCLLLFLIDTLYALLILAFLRLAPPASYFWYFIIFLWVLHTVKYLIITVMMLRILMQWLSVSYQLDGRLLTVATGIYAVKERVYDLDQFQLVHIHQDWIGHLFHFGEITLRPSSPEGVAVSLNDVQNPKQYERGLSEALV